MYCRHGTQLLNAFYARVCLLSFDVLRLAFFRMISVFKVPVIYLELASTFSDFSLGPGPVERNFVLSAGIFL